jgi:hypothetical protein
LTFFFAVLLQDSSELGELPPCAAMSTETLLCIINQAVVFSCLIEQAVDDSCEYAILCAFTGDRPLIMHGQGGKGL